MSRIPDASIIHSRLRLRQLRLMLALEELGRCAAPPTRLA